MNDKAVKQFFTLLQSFIYEEEPADIQEYNWDEIYHYAKIHSLAGIIGYIVTRYELCHDVNYAQNFEYQMIQTYGLQYRRKKQMKRMIDQLNSHEIDHLLMKGYIVKDLYPVPELRYFGDIDFVIRKEDRVKTDLLMKELGFETPENWEPVYTYKRDTEYYEIHTEVLDSEINEGKQRKYFLDIWNHAIRLKEHTFVFSLEYHFIYLLAHLAKHASRRGAGVRMYLDVAIYINTYRRALDWEYILEQLNILELKQFFYTVCTVCEKWFLLEPPCEIVRLDEETAEQFTKFTLEGGLFGFAGTSDKVAVIKESGKTDSKVGIILNQIFPSADEMQPRYKYLQKHRWLLPFAWVDRIFRNSGLLVSRAHTAIDIIKTDESEIKAVKELNKKIGL